MAGRATCRRAASGSRPDSTDGGDGASFPSFFRRRRNRVVVWVLRNRDWKTGGAAAMLRQRHFTEGRPQIHFPASTHLLSDAIR
jgi:hypothetical protein